MGGLEKHGSRHRVSRGLASFATIIGLLVGLLAPRAAQAFCGFYVGGADKKLFNNATLVVLLRDGTRTVLSMQNNYQGPPENFAMVVPVPVVLHKENVKTLPREVFDHVDQLAAPRLVEYWEQDPCAPMPVATAVAAAPATRAKGGARAGSDGDLGVKIEAQFTVGEYDIVILSATDSSGLDKWLTANHYKIPEGAEPYLRPYVRDGSKFFVAKVDVSKVTVVEGRTMLSPLRFHYDTPNFNLPVRLGLANSAGTQDLLVHILARDQRYELANYKNVTIPTNIDLDEKAKDQFPAFYAALFDKTLESNLDSDKRPPVVTEYSWQASNCDPCPGPVLNANDMATLGADTLDMPDPAAPAPAPTAAPAPGPQKGGGPGNRCNCAPGDLMCFMKCNGGAPGGAPGGGVSPGRPGIGGRGSAASYPGWVLTRLHARYTKDQLAEDLVFKAATPISGGREWGANGGPEKGAVPASINNFQGRYAIRHPWTGPIACAEPRRGIWGGPPGGEDGRPKAARDLAFAPRGGVDLPSLVRSNVPEIGVVAKMPLLLPATTSGPASSGGPASSAGSPSGAGASSGCGCRVSDSSNSGVPTGAIVALWGVALGLFVRRRSDRR